MKLLFSILVLLASQARGQTNSLIVSDEVYRALLTDRMNCSLEGAARLTIGTSLSNIVIQTTVVTNEYHPKQYWNNSYGCLVMGCTEDHSFWQDNPTYGFGAKTRDNLDVKITVVRRITTVLFWYEDRQFAVEVKNELISTKKLKREVKQEERWVEQ